ncbi:nucleoside triphosphate pyrophosphohydrolase family protein [Candidatus Sumerlaeota bacterium]|nr:nucleoside triphosphate pyrophosphohydrolase family protein [Candidatus Sumerlaeota bacterium]
MNFNSYQDQAATTDQLPGDDLKARVVPLLGLAGEAGSLLTEYKKQIREGAAYTVFSEQIAEELGDILWYVANIATKAGLRLENIAEENLAKAKERWNDMNATPELFGLLDEAYGEAEQFPRSFCVEVKQVIDNGAVKVILLMDGLSFGDPLTDNAYEDDGYRFHDIFHLSYAAYLGWSPIVRRILKRKRKTRSKIDEVEDGARAAIIEEAISALVFEYAKNRSFFEGVDRVEYALLKQIKDLTAHLEVSHCTLAQWETAIIGGYNVWRQIRKNGGGFVIGDLHKRRFEFQTTA